MMIKLIAFILFVFSTMSLSWSQELSLDKVKDLLIQKEVSLDKLQGQGAKILLGEGSGAGLVMPYQKVLIVLTDNEAILKNEILHTDFKGIAELNNLISLEIHGGVIFKDQVKGVVYQ